MTAVERKRFLQTVVAALHMVRDAITWQTLQSDPFFASLRGRNPRVIATPVLIGLSAVVSIFTQASILDVLISAVCLLQIGLILERIVGRAAFSTVYVASAVAAGMASLAVSPGRFTVVASGPVLGMYGLLLVTSIWTMLRDSSLTMPVSVAQRLAAVAAVFVLHKLTTGLWNVAALAPLACGIVGGLVIARDVGERTPRIRFLAKAMGAVVVVVALYAASAVYRPVSDTTDVRT